jgi:catechol 2,3-dioxygenase-like lactoylglutathione lyase family enzyme
MATKKRRTAKKPEGRTVRQRGTADVPRLFRINVEVGNLAEAETFYSKLLGLKGRPQAGSRCYFDCGPVTLQVLDVSPVRQPHPAAKALYFTVNDLEAVFARAEALNCVGRGDVHGAAGGTISVRPWGERSFYAEDRWGNPLCFVEAGTVYPG